MCECSAIPPSKAITRCFPFGSTLSIRRPFSRASGAGRASTTTLPAIRRLSAAAVRQVVSPSGKNRPAFWPEHDALRRGAEPRLPQRLIVRRILDRDAVDGLDLELVDPGGDRRQRLKMGRLHPGDGQQGSAAALQVEAQL